MENSNYINKAIHSTIQIASVSNGSFASVIHIKTYLTSSYNSASALHNNKDLKELISLTESVAKLVSSLFFSQIGGIIHDTLEIRSGIVDLVQGNTRRAILKISFSTLSLTAQITLNIHARVALVAITIIIDCNHAFKNFKEEHYIEGTTSLICAAIRINKSTSLFKSYQKLWMPSQIERRVAIDVGSGSTKVMIADVNTKNNRIVKVIHKTSIPTAYQKDLENSTNGAFSPEIQETGLDTFKQINELALQYQADKVYAVATSAFRTSNNGETFAQRISESANVPIKIISQFEEGVLAYESVSDAPELQSQDFVCWDIGTGSFQITVPVREIDYSVYMTETGSVPFKNYIIDVVKGQDSNNTDTPNPMTNDAIKQADSYARWIGRHALPSIKESVKAHNGTVVGIGRLFQNSLLPLAEGDQITRKDLRTFIQNASNKTDEDLNNPFAKFDVSNAILALGVMKALHVQNVSVVESTSTRGILAHESYWS